MHPTLDDTLTALADPTRRAIVSILSRGPRRSGDVAAALSKSHPTMSRHLRVLRKSGLVEESIDSEDARVRIYRLKREPFDGLQGWLDDVAAFSDDQLAGLKQHAEQRPGSGTA
jgi:DNA-binding transcriptional ArsR family regulator